MLQLFIRRNEGVGVGVGEYLFHCLSDVIGVESAVKHVAVLA